MFQFQPTAHLILSLCFLLFAKSAWAFTERTAEEEFRIKKEYSQSKIEDFYQRFLQQEQMDAERRKGEEEVRQLRSKARVEAEQRRQEFVKQRRMKPTLDPSQWEAESKLRQKQMSLNRQDYIQRREKLNNLLNSLGRIPEEDEFELNLDFNTEQ